MPLAYSEQVESVRKALLVLEAVGQLQPVGVGELSRAVELPKSSVQRALSTLHAAGWIRPTSTGTTRWEITSKAVQLGQSFASVKGVRELAIPVMEGVRSRIDETVHLMVPDGSAMVLIERLLTQRPVRVEIQLGRSMPMHMTANGKAYLANLEPEEIDSYISSGLSRSTDATVTTPESLRAELDEVRDRGYAVNRGEWRSDVRAVASPIFDQSGKPVASISISTPASRMPASAETRFGQTIRDAASQVSRELGYSNAGPVEGAAARK
jgi:IclR family acetate operon transcriptional repressor